MEQFLTDNTETISIGLAIAAVALFLGIAWQMLNKSPRRVLVDRLDRRRQAGMEKGRKKRGKGHDGLSDRLRKDRSDSSIAGLDKAVKTFVPRTQRLRDRLEKTGTGMTIGTYVLMSLLFGIVGIAIGYLWLGAGAPASLLIGLSCGVAFPHLLVGFLAGRRNKRFIMTLPDALDVMIRGLRSGLPITETMVIVSKEIKGPVAEEFQDIVDAIAVGADFDEALWAVAERIDITDFRFFVVTLSIQRETGGNLAETLSNLADILRKRSQMRLKVKALSSEARASAVIIGLLPFIMFGVIYSVNKEYMSMLLTDNRGIVMLIGAGISLFLGIVVMTRMCKMEV